ncbi:MFS transporter [Anaerocolumna sedimenticola]|uniref:MFS transporter n=1 Tax=Anaerocolumna sedimenticola TaxID=2696063 RepID=A0A6P1TPP5_9FIRM|nr:MFS transporter [Anaerocolumna sedimenticola]QHQ61595.1 MFS transporter [Anaerocolumna sedimenticola]
MKGAGKKINKNLLLLLLGRMVSDTGTGIQMVIIPLYIIDVGGSSATVGLFSFLCLMPTLLVYPFAGVLGDRLNRKRIMITTDLASALVILILAVISHNGSMSLTVMLLVQVIVSILYGFFDPATKGMLPQLVSKDELTQANSILASLRTLAGVISPVLGAALYTNLGVSALFFLNGISFLISGSCSLFIRYKHWDREQVSGETRFLAELSEGVKFILNNLSIRRFCTFFLIIYAMIQPLFTVVLPLFFRNSLKYSDTQYGYLQMAMILGALFGSILVGLLFSKEKVIKSLITGCSMQMVMLTAFYALLLPGSISLLGNDTILYFSLLAGVLCLLSLAIMFINVPVQTFIQKATPDAYMSRVFSIVGMISKGGMPFGALLYGIILSKIQLHWVLLGVLLLMLLISVLFSRGLLKTSELN